MNNAVDLLSHLEIDPNEKIFPKLREDMPSKSIEINIKSKAIAQEDQVFFHNEYTELPSGEHFWRCELEKRENEYRTTIGNHVTLLQK